MHALLATAVTEPATIQQLARENAIIVRFIYPAISALVILFVGAAFEWTRRRINRRIKHLIETNEKILRTVADTPEQDAAISEQRAALSEQRAAINELRAATAELRGMLQVDGVTIQEWAAGQQQRWDEHDRTRAEWREQLDRDQREWRAGIDRELHRIEKMIREEVGPRRRSWLDRMLG